MKPSAVRKSGVDPTLTYSAPICFRKSSSTSVGLGEVCAHSLMPGAFLCTLAEAGEAADRNAVVPKAPPTASLTNSLRSGLKVKLLDTSYFDSEFSIAHLPRSFSIQRCGDEPVYLNLRSEEHTSELQSLRHLVCRLL